MNRPSLPDPFLESLDGLPGIGNPRDLREALDREPAVSIRFNPYKLAEKPEGRQVPWCRYGFMLDGCPQFTPDPLFHGGVYYVQESSSMFVEHIVRSAAGDSGQLRILDLCAAPGGKTTLLSTLAGLEGLVVANDVIRSRTNILADNVRKWGLGNVVVTNNDPSHFSAFRDYFDIVLVDAPCSGEGMFRKNPQARLEWSPGNVELCVGRQRRILSDIWDSLKPGGLLIYSTCTFNRRENEDNVEWFCSEYGCEPVDIGIDPLWGVIKTETRGGVNIFRFYPHLTPGEGFTVSVLRKPDKKSRFKPPKPRKQFFSDMPKSAVREIGRFVAQPEFMDFLSIGDEVYGYYRNAVTDIRMLSATLSAVYSGVGMGQLFKGRLRPSHPLALFHDLDRGVFPESRLELDDMLVYLRKGDPDPALFEEGINLVSFEGVPTGWIKRIGGRTNNMYPKELRIANL